jgi:hypothetical protein
MLYVDRQCLNAVSVQYVGCSVQAYGYLSKTWCSPVDQRQRRLVFIDLVELDKFDLAIFTVLRPSKYAISIHVNFERLRYCGQSNVTQQVTHGKFEVDQRNWTCCSFTTER